MKLRRNKTSIGFNALAYHAFKPMLLLGYFLHDCVVPSSQAEKAFLTLEDYLLPSSREPPHGIEVIARDWAPFLESEMACTEHGDVWTLDNSFLLNFSGHCEHIEQPNCWF